MTKENAIFEQNENYDENLDNIEIDFDLDDLENSLQSQLGDEFQDLDFLKEEREKIANPDNLGNVIMDVAWEQFLIQVASKAGEDFIKDNGGLTLDLRKKAHFQTTENFAKGEIAKHNTIIDYQERYDEWQKNFKKDKNGNVIMHKTRTGKEEATLVKEARYDYDKNRPRGSAEKGTDMDHTVPAGEMIRDAAANAHMTKEERTAFANSDANLYEMDSSLNRSKGDTPMNEWLDSPNAKGQKPNEIFDISPEKEKEMREKDKEAREELEKRKKEGEQKSIEAGKKSQREEAFRISKTAVCYVLTQLLAELLKEIISKLIKWFKSAKRVFSTLYDSIKEAVVSFVGKMKTHLINAGEGVFYTVLTALDPAFRMIKKIPIMLKQGWKSLKEAFQYIKNPDNRKKSTGIFIMELGKIVTVGIAAISTIVLSEVIEKALMVVPIFAFEIPLFGSIANVLGMFFGAVIPAISGAIVINMLEKRIEEKMKNENTVLMIEKGNQILNTQNKIQIINEIKLEETKNKVANNIMERHRMADEKISKASEYVSENCKKDEEISKISNEIDELLSRLKKRR